MKRLKELKSKRPRLATVMAGLALFIVLGGTATAASGLINGKTIKKGTVTAKQIKNKTITKAKLNRKVVKAFTRGGGPAGPQGPQGPKGEPGSNGSNGSNGAKGETGTKGANGAKGATGPAGAITAQYVSSNNNTNLPGGNVVTPLLLNTVPAHKYAVSAKLAGTATGAGGFNCKLLANGFVVDEGGTEFVAAFDEQGIYLQALVPANTTKIQVSCTASKLVQINNRSIISLPVS